MALVSDANIIAFVGNPSADNSLVYALRDAAESMISRYCRRSLESASYSLERYIVDASSRIYLNNYPVTSLRFVSIGSRDALCIYNTNTFSYASVTVTGTSMVLSKDGVADVTLSFLEYTTLGSLVTAINDLGNGWASHLLSSDYSSASSSLIIPTYGLSSTNNAYVYIGIINDPESSFTLHNDSGIIHLDNSIRNVVAYVSYTAGYSSSTIPSDLSLAIKILTKSMYEKKISSSWGVSSYTIGDISYRFLSSNNQNGSIPLEVSDTISKYKRRMV